MTTENEPTTKPNGDGDLSEIRALLASAEERERAANETLTEAKATLARLKLSEPEPDPTKKSAPDPNEELRQKLEAELMASTKRRQQDELRERLALARQGLTVPLSDADLASIVPEVDVRTEEGRSALIAWKAGRSTLFSQVAPPDPIDTGALASTLAEKVNGNPLYTPQRVAAMIAHEQGSR